MKYELEEINAKLKEGNFLPKLSQPVTKELLADPEFDKQFAFLLDLEKSVKDVLESVKSGIKSVVEEQYVSTGDNKIESLSYNVSYKPSYTSNGFDTDKLKQEQPKIYNKYQKVTICSSSITVKRKRG